MTVAVVGLGAMGMPIARRLVSAGYGVAAVDSDAEARARADAAGMRSSEEVPPVGDAGVVLVLVATGAQLLDVVRSRTAGARADGETWVICSTVPATTSPPR